MRTLAKAKLVWLAAVAVAVVVVVLAGNFCKAQVDDRIITIAKGLENREALLQTIECSVTHRSFIGPAHPKRHGRSDSAVVTFAMADITRDRWVAERRVYYLAEDNTLQSRRYLVNIWNEGIHAYKSIDYRDSAVWETDTKLGADIVRGGILQQVLFMSRLSPKIMLARGVLGRGADTITEEIVDGAECFRLQGTGRMGPDMTGYVLHWVDANKGFAVRKWAWLHVRDRDGRVVVDTIGHAYDFREYDGGLWLPMRTKIVRSQLDERLVRNWAELDLYNCVEIKINQQLSETIPRIEGEIPRIAYQARLTDDNEDELERQAEFLEQWRAGPQDPNTFMEPLPDLAEIGE